MQADVNPKTWDSQLSHKEVFSEVDVIVLCSSDLLAVTGMKLQYILLL